jgi:aspartyl-tRNA(Asn)/glutamyl-tRNA(Gln) amidotransferase subunit B
MAWEAVIGLECHVQLRTRTKMFCDCPVRFGAEPNTQVCPVCLGLPGALPRVNTSAIGFALRLGLALECDIRAESVFARKNYFYPDMPKNYQVTQYDRPLCEGGALPAVIDGAERRFALTRIHCEEDAGKSFHPERHGDRSLSRVDFNRAGVPLLELVTEPVLHTPAECAAFLTSLRRLVRALGISDGDMEKGQLRCDANVSLRPAGSTTLGTKTELKNLNSIKGVEKGVAAEIARQARALDAGERIVQATLLYDADHDKLAVMRTKEHAHDYRYLPDPDLPVLRVSAERIEAERAALPELPWVREERFITQYGLPAYDAGVLADSVELADYFEDTVKFDVKPKTASNWIMGKVLSQQKEASVSMEQYRKVVLPEYLALTARAVDSGQVTATGGKSILDEVFAKGVDPSTLFVSHAAISSVEELQPLVRQVLDEHPGPVAQFLAGEGKTLGFLVGQVMKRSAGQAVPQRVQELVRAELERRARGA